MTALPSKQDPRWRDIAAGKTIKPWSVLATRLMMMRILGETKSNPSPANVAKCAAEIYDFFEKNQKIAAADIAVAFG